MAADISRSLLDTMDNKYKDLNTRQLLYLALHRQAQQSHDLDNIREDTTDIRTQCLTSEYSLGLISSPLDFSGFSCFSRKSFLH
jgi:hypothetical protein